MSDMAPPPSDRSVRRQADRRTYVRALAVAALLSISIHLAILYLVSFSYEVEESRGAPPRISVAERVMRAYDISPVASATAPIEVQIRERQQERDALLPAAPLPFGITPPTEEEGAPGVDPGTTIRDPLRYRMGSREVWRPQAPLEEHLTPDERVRARIAAELKQYNDSIQAETDAAARALDWTKRTEDGGRWGISPSGVHLGSITIPRALIPMPNTSPEKAAESRARQRNWAELQRQADRIEVKEVIDERIRLIRERNDQERARQNSVTGGGTTGGGTTGGGTTGGGTTGGGSTGG